MNRQISSYLATDTIAALSTPTGGALAIVRISGPKAVDVLNALVGAKAWTARRMSQAIFKDQAGRALDDGMAAVFYAPASFTGESCVELFIHGSPAVARLIMERLFELGARQALPGEFSFRAVRNAKMSVPQAEAVADLIGSQNDEAVFLALEKMSGTQSTLILSLAEQLKTLAMLTEAGIDFADQDIAEVELPALKQRLIPVVAVLKDLAASFERGQRIQQGVKVALLGLPNAGKSSLFNALLGEDRSIVSDVAGTTRDVVRETISLRARGQSVTLRFSDTAGVRATNDTVEELGVGLSLKEAANADLVLWIVDATQPHAAAELQTGIPTPEFEAIQKKCIQIFTKVDLLKAHELEQLLGTSAAAGTHAPGSAGREAVAALRVATSAQTGQGIQEAIESIVEFCQRWTHRAPQEVVLTRRAQQEATVAALEALARAEAATAIDLMASDVRQALHFLGPVMGETPADEILGRIFSQFCIGK